MAIPAPQPSDGATSAAPPWWAVFSGTADGLVPLADRVADLCAGAVGSPDAQARTRAAVDWLASHAEGTVAVLGCADGELAVRCAERADTVLGVEPHDALRAMALSRTEGSRPSIEVLEASLTDLPLSAGTVDRVILRDVLATVDDPAAVLDEAARVLGGDGRLALTVPFGAGLRPDRRRACYPHELAVLLAGRFAPERFELADGSLRVLARRAGDADVGAPGPLGSLLEEALTAAEDVAIRARADLEQLEADVEDRTWQLDAAARRVAAAEQEVTDHRRAEQRLARERDRLRDEAERREAELADVRAALEAARDGADAEAAQVVELRAALQRERELRDRLTGRRWWQLGEVLFTAVRRPWRIILLPVDVVRILVGRRAGDGR